MKKKVKLAFREFEKEMSVLTREELLRLQGGNGPIDPDDLFELLAHTSNGLHDASYFQGLFVQQFSGMVGGGPSSGGSGNPYALDPANASSFLSVQLGAVSVQPWDLELAIASGMTVIGDIASGGAGSYIVQIYAADGSGNFTYFDAQTGMSGIGNVNFLGNGLIMGFY